VAVRQILVADRPAEIEGLVVEQRHRGFGIGSMLLAEAEKWARSKSCRIVTLRSNVVRKEARPFYEARGYKVVKTQRAFIKNLER